MTRYYKSFLVRGHSLEPLLHNKVWGLVLESWDTFSWAYFDASRQKQATVKKWLSTVYNRYITVYCRKESYDIYDIPINDADIAYYYLFFDPNTDVKIADEEGVNLWEMEALCRRSILGEVFIEDFYLHVLNNLPK